jgi:polysaccharide pyruvyl transferase WcaK-like protein
VELAVVAEDRAGLAERLGVRVLPRGPGGFLQLCATAARSDLVLCGGGGLFQDDDSLVKMPYWGLRVALVRLLCRRVVGYSLGVGPLDAWTSRLFARLAFACMSRVSVRDPRARRIARELTRKPVELVPDPALLLPPASDEQSRSWLAAHDVPLDGSPLVGVALRRWSPARSRLVPHRLAVRLGADPVAAGPESEHLTARLARVLDDVVRRRGAFVVFLPTYDVPHEGDGRVCREVQSRMVSPRTRVLPIDDPALYKGVARQLSVLLGGRMHPTIFAASVGTPVVGLAYNPKFQGLFEMLGLEASLMDVAEFVRQERVEALTALLDRALDDRPEILPRVAGLVEAAWAFTRSVVEEAA